MSEARIPQRMRRTLSVESLEGRHLQSGLTTPRVGQVSAQVERMVAPQRAASRWAWLANTYWYVPKANLPATVFDPTSGALVAVSDQTVFRISGFRRGYFWGETVAQFGNGSPTSAALVGSVTPQGRVLLTFTTPDGMTQGYGVMTRLGGQWTMLNQMFSGSSQGQVGHWAYMVQTRPGMRSWNSLPAVGVSVPTFLANYSLPRPTPIGL